MLGLDAVDGSSTGIAMCQISVSLGEPFKSVVDAVDGSSTGIAMCQIAVSLDERPMSLHGTMRKFDNRGLQVRLRALSRRPGQIAARVAQPVGWVL